MEPTVPPGVVNVGGEWFYEEYARNAGVSSLGLENRSSTNPSTTTTTTPDDAPVTEERKRILDLFRN